MQAFDLLRVAVIALAKREWRRCTCSIALEPIVLSRHSAACSCFSGSATRRTGSRSDSTAASAMRRRGVDLRHAARGRAPARRRALLRHFGSAERFLAASQRNSGARDLAKTARAIYSQLHKAGPGVTLQVAPWAGGPLRHGES